MLLFQKETSYLSGIVNSVLGLPYLVMAAWAWFSLWEFEDHVFKLYLGLDKLDTWWISVVSSHGYF